MPKVARDRAVVDATPAVVIGRVRRGCHHQWRCGLPEPWVVTRADDTGFQVSVGAKCGMDWGRTVVTGRLAEVAPGRTEVEVAMARIGVGFGRVWFLVCFGAFALSLLTGGPAFSTAYFLLMVAIMVAAPGASIHRHDGRARAVLEEVCRVVSQSASTPADELWDLVAELPPDERLRLLGRLWAEPGKRSEGPPLSGLGAPPVRDPSAAELRERA